MTTARQQPTGGIFFDPASIYMEENAQTISAQVNPCRKRDHTVEKKNNNRARSVDGRYAKETTRSAVPGINTPDIALPAFNPPVPNRAWTAMRMGKDIDELTEEEKRDLYVGRDGID